MATDTAVDLEHPAIKPLVDKILSLTRSTLTNAVRDGACAIDLFLKNDRAQSWFGSQHKIRIVHNGEKWGIGVADGLNVDELRGLANLALKIK